MKPRIKILSDGTVECKKTKGWMYENMFNMSILLCWVDFLKQNRSK